LTRARGDSQGAGVMARGGGGGDGGVEGRGVLGFAVFGQLESWEADARAPAPRRTMSAKEGMWRLGKLDL
jgi:hypothetical protein